MYKNKKSFSYFLEEKDDEFLALTKYCEWGSCQKKGEYKAPTSREKLRDFKWFCLEHIKLYNKGWDYFKGRTTDEIYNEINIIACPTNPVLPDEIENYSKKNMSNSLKVIGARIPAFTSIFNVTRQPSLSTRAGISKTGLPIGIMFTGKFDQDFGVLQVGNWFEKLNKDINNINPSMN